MVLFSFKLWLSLIYIHGICSGRLTAVKPCSKIRFSAGLNRVAKKPGLIYVIDMGLSIFIVINSPWNDP